MRELKYSSDFGKVDEHAVFIKSKSTEEIMMGVIRDTDSVRIVFDCLVQAQMNSTARKK